MSLKIKYRDKTYDIKPHITNNHWEKNGTVELIGNEIGLFLHINNEWEWACEKPSMIEIKTEIGNWCKQDYIIWVGNKPLINIFSFGTPLSIVSAWRPIFDMQKLQTVNLSHYPHKCQKCGNPAYVGAYDVDCSNTNCKGK